MGSDIIMLVLTSGEHIIAKYIDMSNEGAITVNDPISLMPDPNPQNSGRLIFIPYLQFTEMKEITFPVHSYRHMISKIKEDLIRTYQEYTGGIVTPKKEILLS